MALIAPSILSANFGALADDVRTLANGKADYIHIDVMDGHFVPNITFGPDLVKAIRPVCSVPFDAHLMIEEPELYVDLFAQAGCDMITVHPEVTIHLNRLLVHIRSLQVKPGVALNPSTSVSAVEWVLGLVDRVLIMTVNPGFGGQAFIPEMLDKIRIVDALRRERGYRFEIGVDGGISEESATLVAKAGADVIIAGSSVFHHAGGPGAAIASLRKAADG